MPGVYSRLREAIASKTGNEHVWAIDVIRQISADQEYTGMESNFVVVGKKPFLIIRQ